MVNPAEVPTVDVPELPAEFALLDVRENYEWAAGHAPGAVHIPMSELPGRVAELPAADQLFVICRSGVRSANVAAWLNGQGREAVNVAGGMQSWHAHGRPMVTDQGAEPQVV
ncbi:rhodanese-like domain-containing protein [Amycolatopsis sp. 195334CR]|uniref:rhodanese-like domain-containing protein n=1 Tax=Amycolatopsis sp. 195334CR TaxID=2814588 RepID=UPI001A904D6B|nr:rhodanese-like domain-containing protein [Amycolatopsis sp. 195334CR]MBN6035444.1 rhodanese-like domain-containing protein [Amycolatopsis sp. 195334CR]